jgi:hypothetical protein
MGRDAYKVLRQTLQRLREQSMAATKKGNPKKQRGKNSEEMTEKCPLDP